MNIGDRRISDLITASPEVEDILEEAGVDYWFGWDRPLRLACLSAGVAVDALAGRVAACRACAGEAPAVDLQGLLRQSDEHWNRKLAPGITAASGAAARLTSHGGDKAIRLLNKLHEGFSRHMTTCRALLNSVDAMGAQQIDVVSKETLRQLRLEHLGFIRIANELRGEAGRLATESDSAEVAGALRHVVRETHRHLKAAYNFILPLLVPAVARHPAAGEPW